MNVKNKKAFSIDEKVIVIFDSNKELDNFINNPKCNVLFGEKAMKAKPMVL